MNRISILLIFCTFSFGCDKAPKVNQNNTSNSSQAAAHSNETQEMVALLEEIKTNLGTRTFYFNNLSKGQMMAKKVGQTNDFAQQVQLGFESSKAFIYANSNEIAIKNLSHLIESIKGNVSDNNIYEFERTLALAYMRLGEQANCLQQTNDDSCLMPIEGKGVYAVKEGVRAAIQIYERMLKRRPDDKETIWMLNFAYMTLGEFPQKVPQQYRLSMKEFQSDKQIPRFKNVASILGLNTNALSGGIAMEDFDNDGFLDIMASSWGLGDQLRFFKNNGNGTFSEKTKEAGLTGLTGGLNIQHADYNNDGFNDVLVLRGAWLNKNGQIPNSLLKNNGDGTFSDVTKSAGVFSKNPTQTAVFADFNLDGWLDLFIGNETSNSLRTKCEFFLANGDSTFSNRTDAVGLGQIAGMVKGVSAGDLNNDGYPDLFLSILGKPNILLKNMGANSSEVKFQTVTNSQTNMPLMSFPTWIWDYNNDGLLDIFVAAFGADNQPMADPGSAAKMAADNYAGKNVGATPKSYFNNGNFSFAEKSNSLGLDQAMLAMGCNYGDLDNDGFEDFYLGTGAPSFTAIVPNKMFLNSEGKRFLDVTTAAGVGHIQKGHAVGFGDLDNDGDQDIFCVLGGAFDGDVFGDALFLNPFGNEKNWISLKLEGTVANKSAIGARIKLIAQKRDGSNLILHKHVSTGSSFGGNSLQVEMGLDDATVVKRIEVIWPNKEQSKTIIENIEINKFYYLKEGSDQLKELQKKKLDFS